MAEIRVERKSGFPWWVYLLGLLALLAGVVFAMRGCGVATDAVNTPDDRAGLTTQAAGTAREEPITDITLFGSTMDKRLLVGRAVDLQQVPVSRVLSDRVFTVRAAAGEMFVMLDERLNAGAAEGAFEARPGAMVHLRGSVQAVPDAQTQDEQGRGLNPQEYQELKEQTVYLRAMNARTMK